jgi:hypothetical protein
MVIPSCSIDMRSSSRGGENHCNHKDTKTSLKERKRKINNKKESIKIATNVWCYI